MSARRPGWWARLHARLALPVVLAERSLALALALALVAAATQWLLWLQRGPPAVDTFVGPPRSDYTLDDFEMTQFGDDGSFSFAVTAPRLAKHPQLGSFAITTPHFRLEDGKGHDWTAVAREGWVRGDGEELRLSGEVAIDRVATADVPPAAIRTERLTVRPEPGEVETDAAVTIRRPGSILRGTGLFADLAQDRVLLRDQVSARYDPKL